MNISIVEECPHCSKRLANALDHWAKGFRKGLVSDDFADEIAEILEDKAESLRMKHIVTTAETLKQERWRDEL